MRDWPKNDIIIDTNKGYALRRLGAYSPNVIEEIVHTFVPLSNFCVASPQTDICVYASVPVRTDIAQLAIMMTPRHTVRTPSSYDRDSVSRLIMKDISRVLAQHHPDEVIKNAKSIVHFVGNQFYHQKSDAGALMTTSPTNTIDDYSGISRIRSTSIEMILKQISSNRIGFEFLSYTDLKLLLAAIFSTIDASYTIFNVQESLDTFSQFILGQSVFALRYCSLGQRNSLPAQPCLAISTLFLRIPPDTTSAFSIYRLMPLPIIHSGDMYIYSNLPKIIGINSIDQTFLSWKEEIDIKECTFSPLVQCRKIPVTTSLSKSSCLTQLLNDDQSATNMCQVTRSTNIEQDIMQIDDGIWFFYNIRQAHHCQVYSTSNDLIESISITEPTIVSIPCNKTVTCMDSQLPISPCTQRRQRVHQCGSREK
ncbi:unnamed protein product [Rotaria sordida]|uniref:Uncharacterized protein n=1 Tax=Rotaria sordida TaxID=392033 RepID=A0A814QJ28_9BILA|nr:unnamed protein product [Rotaria sordida]